MHALSSPESLFTAETMSQLNYVFYNTYDGALSVLSDYTQQSFNSLIHLLLSISFRKALLLVCKM
jgi:hypothetical protein